MWLSTRNVSRPARIRSRNGRAFTSAATAPRPTGTRSRIHLINKNFIVHYNVPGFLLKHGFTFDKNKKNLNMGPVCRSSWDKNGHSDLKSGQTISFNMNKSYRRRFPICWPWFMHIHQDLIVSRRRVKYG